MDIAKLVRKNILQLKPYSSARHEFEGIADIYLDANENPFGDGLNRYPDPLQHAVKTRISQIKQVRESRIFLGNGSDEAIDLLIRIFCEPGEDHIIIMPPTYGMYRVAADISDVGVREVPLKFDYQPNVEGVLEAADKQSKLLFLCSPNNPTGNDIHPEHIEKLAGEFPGIVVVDEAYIDFSPRKSCTKMLADYPNLVVLQTFSKAWGMAGIRLGMAFASQEIIGLFNKVKPPYNISQLTQQRALKAMEHPESIEKIVEKLLTEKENLADALAEFDFVEIVHHSDANFLLVKVEDPRHLYRYLKDKGIIVRDRSRVHLCEGSLRITVGTPEENRRLINTLEQYRTVS